MAYPPSAYLKSLLYLVTFTGIGYVLMKLTEPNAKKLQKIRETGNNNNDLSYEQRQKKLMLDRIKSLSEDSKPVYLKTADELRASKDK